MTRQAFFRSWNGEVRFVDNVAATHALPGLYVSPAMDASGRRPRATSVTEDAMRSSAAWSTDQAHGMVVLETISSHVCAWSCTWQPRSTWSPESIAWEFELTIDQPQVLSPRYRLAPLRGTTLVDAWTPLLLRGRQGTEWIQVVAVDRPAAVTLERTSRGVRCRVWIDHEWLHPRFSFDASLARCWNNRYTFTPNTMRSVSFRLMTSSQELPSLVVGRYADNYQAAMTITDHADHDTTAKWSALMYGDSRHATVATPTRDGFVGTRLGFTKTIFTEATEEGIGGLHDAQFTQLCHRAHEAGIEICPHGIHCTRQPELSAIPGLLQRFQPFRPRTWVDHGFSFRSNYAREGWNPESPYALHAHLDQLGIQYLWGFQDFAHGVPRGCLDQLDTRWYSGVSLARELLPLAARALRSRRPLAWVHGLSVLAFQMIPDACMSDYFAVQRQMQAFLRERNGRALMAFCQSLLTLTGKLARPTGLAAMTRHATGLRDELRMVPLLFREHYSHDHPSTPRWLFNTVAVHDVVTSFAPTALDRLQDDYGIHLAHTYLGSVSRAHVGHAIEPAGGGHWKLSAGFAANLRAIAQRRDEGTLWFAPLADLADFLIYQRSIRLAPLDHNVWEINLPAWDATSNVPTAAQLMIVGSSRSMHCEQQQLSYRRHRHNLPYSLLAIGGSASTRKVVIA